MSDNRCDVLVIGEGLSGIVAAATAAIHGARVTLATKGPGRFVLGAACVNLDGINSVGSVDRSAMDAAVEFFLNLTASAQCGYSGGTRERRLVPTIVGTFQTVSLAPRPLWQADPRSAEKVVIAGVANLPGFDANFIAERLSFNCREMGLNTSYRAEVVTLPHNPKHALTAMEIASHIDRDPAYRGAVLHALKGVVKDGELLIVPGILGVKTNDSDLAWVEAEVGCGICELPTLPPSVPGLRLLQRLEARLTELGVDLNAGFAVQKLCIENNRCVAVELETPGRPRRIRADEVLVACGRFAGFLEAQPMEFTGCSTGAATNLFGCGSVLGQVEPRHRNGVAIVTGHQAGMLASRQGVQYAGR